VHNVILVETDFERMTEAELRFTALRFESLFQETGWEGFREFADEVDEVRLRQMLAAPNPYDEPTARRNAEAFE
jgi:hypothetical protein